MGGYLMWGTEWVTNAKKRYKENRAHATKANDEAHQVARKQDPQIPHAENGGGDATSRAKNGKDSEFPRRDYKNWNIELPKRPIIVVSRGAITKLDLKSWLPLNSFPGNH